MFIGKSVCMSLLISLCLNCTLAMAQETEATDGLIKKANKYFQQTDYQQAMYWYQKAAAKGDAEAMHNIAYLYDEGLGVKRDKQQAAQWYQKAQAALQ